MTWQMDLQQELRDLIQWLDQYEFCPSVLDVKNRMRAIYNKLPAIIGTTGLPEKDETNFRLEKCEEKINSILKAEQPVTVISELEGIHHRIKVLEENINKITLWIREARQI